MKLCENKNIMYIIYLDFIYQKSFYAKQFGLKEKQRERGRCKNKTLFYLTYIKINAPVAVIEPLFVIKRTEEFAGLPAL